MRSLISAGNEIGNHTVDHVSLPYLTTANMAYQVDAASDRIAAAVGVRPKSFAYPMGSITNPSMAAVAACSGIEIGVTEYRAIGQSYVGRFDVPRLEILKKVFPSFGEAARPIDLFESDRPEIFALRVKKPFGEWLVLGLFNADEKAPAEKPAPSPRLTGMPYRTEPKVSAPSPSSVEKKTSFWVMVPSRDGL